MSNAAKHRKKAAEFEQLKQIDRAIASYMKAIEESEAAKEDVDVALFNKVGDLALRQGRIPDAITYYERAVEHYATSGLFNNAIALCNKILRSAPGRANVYFTLGRICARKGLRGDATRNFLEYATRMREEERVEEGMRALAEIADLFPDLTEVGKLVDEHARRAGVVLPRRLTPPIAAVAVEAAPVTVKGRNAKSPDLVFIHDDYSQAEPAAPAPVAATPVRSRTPVRAAAPIAAPPIAAPPVAAASVTATPVAAVPVMDTLAAALIEPGPGLRLLRDLASRAGVATTPVEPIDGLQSAMDGGAEQPTPDGPAGEESPDSPAIEAMATAAVATAADEGAAAAVDLTQTDRAEEDPAPTWVTGSADEIDSPTDQPVLPAAPDAPLEEVVPFGQSDTPPTAEPASVDAMVVVPVHPDGEASESPADITRADIEPVATETALLESLATGPVATGLPAEALIGLVEAAAPDPVREEPVDSGSDADALVTDLPRVETMDATGAADLESVPPAMAPIEAVRITPLMLHFDLEAITEQVPETRPPFRVDPHDFILPGELPPLLLDDAIADAGLAPAAATSSSIAAVDTGAEATGPESGALATAAAGRLDVAPELGAPGIVVENALVDAASAPSNGGGRVSVSMLGLETVEVLDPSESGADAVWPGAAGASEATLPSAEDFEAAADALEPPADGPTLPPPRHIVPTPALPTAAVAAEAAILATSRRDALRAAVSRLPSNWGLRRRLAEALLESGEREEALQQLNTARQGFVNAGNLSAAAEIGDEMVQVSPDQIPFHQHRVELAVAMHDLQRLRMAYLDLADALVRRGEEGRARVVYARVLEIDPLDDRARAALGPAAPPPPPPAARPDDQFVDLATWLKEDEGSPGDTRLRMREPRMSGDEQADFDELLRHFKEGVARSLGEDDFESHYDLGVAFKEMGLLDDAIAEFQKALRGHGNRLPAYEALGQCFVEQGRHQVAATVLTRALHEPGLGDGHRVGVLYLLAFACEALQRPDEARSYYQRVYAIDIQFRDTAARLAALEHRAR